jgi:hypothetical protein
MSAKAVHRALMKVTPGLNSIKVLGTAFTLMGPKSIRIQSSSQYLFMLLGTMGAKAARRALIKLTPVSATTLRPAFP